MQTKFLLNSQETEIPYEEIDDKKIIRENQISYLAIIISLIMILVVILNLVDLFQGATDIKLGGFIAMFIVTSISIFFALAGYYKELRIPISRNENKLMYGAIPSEVDVDAFLAELTNAINKHLKRKYASVDRLLPIEQQLYNLIYLKDRGVISEAEFEELKGKLVGISSPENQIGFRL